MLAKEILKKVRRIEIITRRMVNDVMAGEYHSVFKGRGMEFDEVREYSDGDDIRTIDWNVTARTGFPHVKRYVEERELTVMLAVDASSSSEFGSQEQLKGEIAAELCALLAFSAIKNNDRVGLVIFTDKIEKFIPPKKGRKHVLRVIREVLAFKPQNQKTNLNIALDYIMRILNRKSVVFLLSDFISEDAFYKTLGIVNQRHDLISLTILDPREISLPAVGFLELEDAETGEIIILDTYDREVRESFSRNASSALDELMKQFKMMKIDSIPIWTDKPYSDALIRFFRERARRL